jgi:hypothetical protein
VPSISNCPSASPFWVGRSARQPQGGGRPPDGPRRDRGDPRRRSVVDLGRQRAALAAVGAAANVWTPRWALREAHARTGTSLLPAAGTTYERTIVPALAQLGRPRGRSASATTSGPSKNSSRSCPTALRSNGCDRFTSPGRRIRRCRRPRGCQRVMQQLPLSLSILPDLIKKAPVQTMFPGSGPRSRSGRLEQRVGEPIGPEVTTTTVGDTASQGRSASSGSTKPSSSPPRYASRPGAGQRSSAGGREGARRDGASPSSVTPPAPHRIGAESRFSAGGLPLGVVATPALALRSRSWRCAPPPLAGPPTTPRR